MTELIKERLKIYTMKMRLYPSPAQAEKIDRIFKGLQLAYNITFHEVFQQNPQVCTTPRADGDIWPDFRKMATKEWKQELIKRKPEIAEVPAAAITTNNGLFLRDGRSAWKKGMHNFPINRVKRKDFRFYNASKKRSSYMVQMDATKLEPSISNEKVAWVTLSGVDGKVKARGFNRKILFGKDGKHTYREAVMNGEIATRLTVRISKDSCGDYYLSVTFNGENRDLYRLKKASAHSEALGLDIGNKDVAVLSDGRKVENEHFRQKKEKSLKKMHLQLSRRWGPSNEEFRWLNGKMQTENISEGTQSREHLAESSKGYMKIRKNYARLERKISRRREAFYHYKTAEIVDGASVIAVETLYIKEIMQNQQLEYALRDAAVGKFLRLLEYKAQRSKIPLVMTGIRETTRQKCCCCGVINNIAVDRRGRSWTCMNCEEKHDRNVNAARNILSAALEDWNYEDNEIREKNIS